MLTPTQLYNEYSLSLCDFNFPYDIGRGTPYDLVRLVKFIKHLKRPCYNLVTKNIDGTGANKLGIPFKFLMQLDADAFKEIQPTMQSGTSHGIRNACDITRACNIEHTKEYSQWESRMATEYLEYYGKNSLYDCLMMLGPDLVSDTVAENRATGCGGDLSCFQNSSNGSRNGALGAAHGCQRDSPAGQLYCGSCQKCEGDPPSPSDPCCSNICEERINKCCRQPTTTRFDFSYLLPSDDNLFGGNIWTGWIAKFLKHIGILKRKKYDGYANFLDSSGSNLNACGEDLFFRYFQSINGYNYDNDTSIAGSIDRMRTISFIQGNHSNSIKDLLYNGYGVILFTNVGFPNYRDSTGLSYPDRNWYHTYSIIGYDDRKIEYPECVFLLANSWGAWNSGGQPSWGPIPDGSFLVTETHLNCMVTFNQFPDFIGCRGAKCPVNPCTPELQLIYPPGCIDNSSCVPFYCSDHQRAFGLAIALSTTDNFNKRNLDYKQFYPINKLRALDNESMLYFDP